MLRPTGSPLATMYVLAYDIVFRHILTFAQHNFPQEYVEISIEFWVARLSQIAQQLQFRSRNINRVVPAERIVV